MTNKLCKIIFLLLAACCLFFPNETFAEEKIIEAVGEYVVGDGSDESPKVAKERARQDALRIALDKAGVYVESFSEMKNFRLTKDEIKIIAGEVISVTNETYDVEILPNEVIRYTATIQAVVDTDVIAAKINRLESDGKNFSDESDRLREENEKIKAELDAEKSSDDAEKFLIAGNDAFKAGDYPTAINFFDKAIALQEDYTDAWFSRAKAHEAAKNFQAALNDYTRLIDLTEESADAFYLRGALYAKIGDRDNALKDFDRALKKSPNDKRTIRAREKLLADGK